MAEESNVFTLTLDDEQQAATAGTPFAGTAGSFTRDGVVTHYATEKTDAGHVYTVTVLERPFCVPMADIQKYITDLLIPPEPPAAAAKTAPAGTHANATAEQKKPAPVVEHRRENR